MISAADISGMILAGGKSSRMGSDKALLDVAGSTFIERIAGAMRVVLPSVSVVTDGSDRYSKLGIPLIRDIYEQCGPLGGLHAALRASTTPHILLMTCDTPLVNSAFIIRLLEESVPDEISVCSDGDRVHPLIGVYPVSISGRLEMALDSGVRKVMEYLGGETWRALEFTEWSNAMKNINTPGEYTDLSLSKKQSDN